MADDRPVKNIGSGFDSTQNWDWLEGELDARDPLIGSYVTSLPASPVNGQEVYYMADSLTVWHLRYNTNVSGSYKWQYVGGPPIRNQVDTQSYPTNIGNWYGLTVGGATPALTCPLAGIYDVYWGAEVYAAVGYYIYVGVNMSGAGTWSSVLFGAAASGSASYSTISKRTRMTTTIATGGTLAMYYWSNASNILLTNAAFRFLEATPVYVG